MLAKLAILTALADLAPGSIYLSEGTPSRLIT